MSFRRADISDRQDPDAGDGAPGVEAFDWQAIRNTVISYVVQRGQPWHLAEDVAQDTIAALIDYTATQRPGSIYALAFRIASNRLVDHFRKNSRFSGEPDEDRSCDAPLPDQVAEGKRKLAILQHAIAAMPRLRREVILRRRLDDQPHAGIASDLGLSLASVEKHVTRGMNDLRAALAAAETGGKAG